MQVDTIINKEAVDLIRSTAFFRYDKENVEHETSQNYWIRVLYLLDKIARSYTSAKSKNRYNYMSMMVSLREAIYDHTTLEIVLKTLESMNMILVCKEKIGAFIYEINEEILCDQYKLDVTKREFNLFEALSNKQAKRASKAITDDEVIIDISKDEFFNLISDKDEDTKKEQWKTICKINSSKKITGTQKPNRRLYNDITSLSKNIHPYIRLKGLPVCELDQHCTFFTILPTAIRKAYTKKISRLAEIELNRWKTICNEENIYSYLSSNISISFESTKENINSFICDSSYSMSGEKEKIQTWFNAFFPELTKMINELRESKRLYSEIVKIEIDIFVRTSKNCKKLGIPAFTKHDAIFCNEKDFETVKKMLDERFVNKYIPNRVKSKVYQVSLRSSASHGSFSNSLIRPTDAQINHEKEGREGRTMVCDPCILDQSLSAQTHSYPPKPVESGEMCQSLSAQTHSYPPKPVESGEMCQSLSAQTLDERDKIIEELRLENKQLREIIERSDSAKRIIQKDGSRNKKSEVKRLNDGRYQISIKNVNYKSRKNESLDEFKARVGLVTDTPSQSLPEVATEVCGAVSMVVPQIPTPESKPFKKELKTEVRSVFDIMRDELQEENV